MNKANLHTKSSLTLIGFQSIMWKEANNCCFLPQKNKGRYPNDMQRNCCRGRHTVLPILQSVPVFPLGQGSQTRGPRGPFVRPAMHFGNFQIIKHFVATCLENRCRDIIESKMNNTQCGFRPGRRTTDHISLSSKIFRNLESMLKTSSHALSNSRKYTTRFLVKGYGECCVSTVLMVACYWPSSHCVPAQTFASVQGELNHDRSSLGLDSDKGVCCHRSFSKSMSVILNLFAEGSQIKTYGFVGEFH